MKKIKYREFVRHTGKYLVPGKAWTVEGRDADLVVTIAEVGADVPKARYITQYKKQINIYGCGCGKVEGKKVCPKHRRA